MSKGVLFVAFDSTLDNGKTLRYTELAKIAAQQVRRHLKLPVAVVTDHHVDGFDCVITVAKPNSSTRHTLAGSYKWYNDYRRQLYDLTPWNQTLLLDVDYLLQTDQLLALFDTNYEFAIAGNVYDPTGRNSFDKYARLPNRTIPQCWATAIYWNQQARAHFKYANMIAEHYRYYARVFGFDSTQIRNDMIFSIVAHMLPSVTIPQRMWMMSSDCRLVDADCRGLKFEYDNTVIRINNDVHILDKGILANESRLDLLRNWTNVSS